MACVEIRYSEGPEYEIQSKRLEGQKAGYNTTEDLYFVKIWADQETFAVLKDKVLSIEHSDE